MRRLGPDEEELLQKYAELAQLESELAESELNLATLLADLHAFEQQYVRRTGAAYAQLDELKARIAEALAGRSQDAQAKAEAEEARRRAQESKETSDRVAGLGESPFVYRSDELKALYRAVARKIHPDLGKDDADRERRTRLMAEANRAYEAGDEARLAAILAGWEDSPDSFDGADIAAQLARVVKRIAQVRARLDAISREVASVQERTLWQLKEKVEAAREQGRDLIQEIVDIVSEQIARERQRLNDVQAGQARP